MNPQPDQDLEYRLQQLEAELGSPPNSSATVSQPQKQPPEHQTQTWQLQFDRLVTWFSSLSVFGKLSVLSVTAIVGLTMLQAFLKLVAAAFSLVILSGLLYFGYKFFLARSAETKN